MLPNRFTVAPVFENVVFHIGTPSTTSSTVSIPAEDNPDKDRLDRMLLPDTFSTVTGVEPTLAETILVKDAGAALSYG